MICSRCGEASAVELLASSAGRALPPACVAVGHLVRVLSSLASLLTSFSLRLPATHPEMLIVLSFLSPCSWHRVTGPLPGLAQLMACLCFQTGLHARSHLVAGVAPFQGCRSLEPSLMSPVIWSSLGLASQTCPGLCAGEAQALLMWLTAKPFFLTYWTLTGTHPVPFFVVLRTEPQALCMQVNTVIELHCQPSIFFSLKSSLADRSSFLFL